MSGNSDPYPRFSDGELERRLQAMHEVMEAAGVAHLVAGHRPLHDVPRGLRRIG